VSTDAVADPTRTNPEGEDTGAAGGHSHDFDINWTHRVGTGYFNSLQCSPPLARCKMPTALGGVVRLS